MKLWILAAAVLATVTVASCGGLAFTAANAPALFGAFQRRADIHYGAHERQRLDVYLPKREAAQRSDESAAPRPIIVFWYGGSFERGRKSQYRFVGAALAEAGYVAVLPDYRLYPEVRFPAFIDDGAQAVAWVASHAAELGGDPSRIYLAGHSAGANIAGMLAYDPERLARVGVRADAIRGFIGLSGPYALDPNTDTLRTIFAAPHGFDDWQPARRVRPGAPRALLMHGEGDDVVSVRHARVMAEALTNNGVPVTLRTYAGRGHADTVAAFATASPDKLPVLTEIRKFIGEETPGGEPTGR
ncbi:MAG TPA: alpha/beta hydrolase [Steroidobacteraceae bacterium]|nr:alpha/beta hydrolase [Steroidobacteraceae bacterium]